MKSGYIWILIGVLAAVISKIGHTYKFPLILEALAVALAAFSIPYGFYLLRIKKKEDLSAPLQLPKEGAEQDAVNAKIAKKEAKRLLKEKKKLGKIEGDES